MGDFLRQGQGPGLTPPFNPAAGQQPDIGMLLFPMILQQLLGGQGPGQGIFGQTMMPPEQAPSTPAQGAGPAPPGGISAPTSGGTPGPGAGRTDVMAQMMELLMSGAAGGGGLLGRGF